MFLIPFLRQESTKKLKSSIRKSTEKSRPIFYDLLLIFAPSWDPLGPPWRPFFTQKAPIVPEPISSGSVFVISMCFWMLWNNANRCSWRKYPPTSTAGYSSPTYSTTARHHGVARRKSIRAWLAATHRARCKT